MQRTTETKEIILALDTATTTGYAIYQNGKIIDHSIWRFNILDRHKQLYAQLTKTIRKHHITTIVAEDIFRSKDQRLISAFQVLSELRGVIELTAQRHDLNLSFINPLIIKRHMIPSFSYTNKGSRADQKKAMINAITRLGYTLNTTKDDEADAIGILVTYVDGMRYQLQHPS